MGEIVLLSQLPGPMTPADCDLRGVPDMPFDFAAFLQDDLFLASSPKGFRAGFALWCEP
jgi:hypothetical protein